MFKSKLVRGSEEQEKIWEAFLDNDESLVINSVAGSGKTFTGVQACMRDKHSKIAYVAFNKHIQVELTKQIQQPNVTCMTYHGLGYAALRNTLGRVEVDEDKLDKILQDLVVSYTPNREGYIRTRTKKLVSLAKQYAVEERVDLERLVDHHTIDLAGIENEVYDYVPKAMKLCMEQKSVIDYDDMVWMPRVLDIKMPRYDILVIDEAQDTNLSQQWLALKSSKRIVVVGDKNQAIYGFRGSDVESINRLKDKLVKRSNGCLEFGLTYTRRCPKSHVELAQKLVPEIKALDTAPNGIVKSMDFQKAANEMKPGDMAICRVNGPLLETAYSLIKNGIKAVVRGRDIGDGIIKFIEKAEKRAGTDKTEDVLRAANDIMVEEQAKYRAVPGSRGEQRAQAAQDRYECLVTLSLESARSGEIKARTSRIFSDFADDGKPNEAVVLGTVHRTKGLEANRVFVLKPELMPHPMARKPWEMVQELNLAYVAATRAVYNNKSDGELIFVGQQPSVFGSVKTEQDQVLNEKPEKQSRFIWGENGMVDNERTK